MRKSVYFIKVKKKYMRSCFDINRQTKFKIEAYNYLFKSFNETIYHEEVNYFILCCKSLNGGLVMVSFDSAHLSCGDKSSIHDVIGA